MDTRRWQARIGACAVAAVALVVMAGCGGSSSKSTGTSAGSSAQGQSVRGTISKGPGVAVAQAEPALGRSWLAQALELLVGTAEAVGTPAVGVTVNLTCAGGGSNLSTKTNSQGKFEFENVTGGPCQVTAVVGGTPIVLLSDITPGKTPVEVEGVLNAVTPPTPAGGVMVQRIEIEADGDDDHGHHHERHDGDVHGDDDHRLPGTVSSSRGQNAQGDQDEDD